MEHPRKQWAVIVHGYIEGYEKDAELTIDCECLLAPRFMKGRGRGKRPGFCSSGCRVKVEARVYHDCSRREVLQALIDFDRFDVVPRSMVEGDADEMIHETERHRQNAREVLY